MLPFDNEVALFAFRDQAHGPFTALAFRKRRLWCYQCHPAFENIHGFGRFESAEDRQKQREYYAPLGVKAFLAPGSNLPKGGRISHEF